MGGVQGFDLSHIRRVPSVSLLNRQFQVKLLAALNTQHGLHVFPAMFFLLLVLLCAQKIQGQDEIIGVADTGLDLNHCQFSEDDGDSITPSDWDDPVNDLTKRKVVQYIDFVDDFDGESKQSFHDALISGLV